MITPTSLDSQPHPLPRTRPARAIALPIDRIVAESVWIAVAIGLGVLWIITAI